MDSFPLLCALSLIALPLACLLSLRRRRKLPPGPYPLPIIGNLLHVGRKPYESLAQLSKKHGPLMSIRLGSVYSVVVSSPEMAKEILQKHGGVFSGRATCDSFLVHDHGKVSMALLPTDSTWRDLRKICKEEMFVHHSLEGSEGLRREKLQKLLDYVQECCDSGQAVDLREASFRTTYELMSATVFSTQGTDHFDPGDSREFMEMLDRIVNVETNFADFFPFLKPFDPQGVKRRVEICFGKMLDKIERYVDQRMQSRKTNAKTKTKSDFLDAILDKMEGNEYPLITTRHLTHLMLDLFVGGTHSTSTTIEWIMSELALHPEEMGKVKDELKRVVGEKKIVEESDVGRLPYLRAVIKEVFRYHAPGPLLLPRKAEREQEVNGYLIPKGTQIIINAWGMGKDPSIWKNPESFEPQRFLHQNLDFKGQDFEFIPFGSGRRICPGMTFADRIMHTTVSTLVHNFDWKFEPGMVETDNDSQMCGPSLRRAVPLTIIPVTITS